MNGTTGNSSAGLHPETVAYLVFGYPVSVAAIILNILEICIIRKRWRKVTDFKLILFNLATVDCLTGIVFLSLIGTETYLILNNVHVHNEIMAAIYLLIVVSVIVSVNFVILIGIERLFAVRLPIQHRMFHMKRRRVYIAVALIWLVTILACALAITLDQVINDTVIETYGSTHLGYTCGTVLSLQSLIVLLLYSSLSFYVLKRQSRFNKIGEAHSARRDLATSLKKERVTLIVCFLIVASFLVCTTPFSIRMYQERTEEIERILLLSNSLINPLIYFFMGLAEKYYRRRGMADINLKANNQMEKVGSQHVREVAN